MERENAFWWHYCHLWKQLTNIVCINHQDDVVVVDEGEEDDEGDEEEGVEDEEEDAYL